MIMIMCVCIFMIMVMVVYVDVCDAVDVGVADAVADHAVGVCMAMD